MTSPNDAERIREDYQRDGFVLLKGVFSSAEVADFRERIRTASLEPKKDDELMGRDEMRPILLDERVLGPLRLILGPKLVYFGDSTFRYETTDGKRAFHRDSQLDFEDPTITDYPIVRVGIYLQDHARHGGGLKVRRGSYRHVFVGRENLRRILFGKPYGPMSLDAYKLAPGVNIPSEAGDLIIWSLRTWHSGYAVRLKSFPDFCVNPYLEKYIPESITLPALKPRAILFFTYGAPSQNLETYIRERTDAPENAVHWQRSRFDAPAVATDCAAKGVALRFDALRIRDARPAK